MDFDYFLEETGCSCPDCSEDKKNKCRHVYEYVYAEICPDCGQKTCEPNYELDHKLFKEYYESDKPKEYKCPIEGGTIRGWWSI